MIFIPTLVSNYEDKDNDDDRTSKQANKQTNVHDTIINNGYDSFGSKLVVVACTLFVGIEVAFARLLLFKPSIDTRFVLRIKENVPAR